MNVVLCYSDNQAFIICMVGRGRAADAPLLHRSFFYSSSIVTLQFFDGGKKECRARAVKNAARHRTRVGLRVNVEGNGRDRIAVNTGPCGCRRA